MPEKNAEFLCGGEGIIQSPLPTLTGLEVEAVKPLLLYTGEMNKSAEKTNKYDQSDPPETYQLNLKFESENRLKILNFVEEFKNMSNLIEVSQAGTRKKPYLSDLPDPCI